MNNNLNAQKSTVKLAKMSILVAISLVLVAFIHIPIFPVVSFLQYDPADVSILMGAFAFGPVAGVLMTAVVSVVQAYAISGDGVYGMLMHFIATGAFVLMAGSVYHFKKTKKGALIALALGTLTMVAAMYFANIWITPFYTGWPVEAVKELMPFILAFNFIKAGLNSVITFLLYKHVSGFLHR